MMNEKLKTFIEIFVMIAIISGLFWIFISTDLKKRHDEIYLKGYNHALDRCKDFNFWFALQNQEEHRNYGIYGHDDVIINLTSPLTLNSNSSNISQQSQVE